MLRKSVLLSVFILCTLTCLAQEQPVEPSIPKKGKELWVGVRDLSPITLSLGYKHQVAPKWYMSYRLFNLQYSTSISSNVFHNESVSYSAYVGAGIEKRHNLTENLLFFHGPELSGGVSKQDTQQHNEDGFWYSTNSINYYAGLGYRLGMKLQVKKHGFIALHLAPYLNYTQSTFKSQGNPQISNGKSQDLSFTIFNSPEFSIGYRF